MKRIINFIFVLVISILFVIGCAEPETNNNTSNDGGEDVAPGTIEETPEDVQILIAAKEKLAPTADDAIFFYYRPDSDYTDWQIWLWAEGAEGAAIGFTNTLDVDGKKVAYVNFNNNSEVSSAISDILNSNAKVNVLSSYISSI